MRIVKRLDPVDLSQGQCSTEFNCPAVFELSDGDIAFIGVDGTSELKEELPSGSGIGPGERLVVLPRSILISAGWDLKGDGSGEG